MSEDQVFIRQYTLCTGSGITTKPAQPPRTRYWLRNLQVPVTSGTSIEPTNTVYFQDDAEECEKFFIDTLVRPIALTSLVPTVLTGLADCILLEDFDVEVILSKAGIEGRGVGSATGFSFEIGPKILLCKDRNRHNSDPGAFLTIHYSDSIKSIEPTDVAALTHLEPSTFLLSHIRDNHDF